MTAIGEESLATILVPASTVFEPRISTDRPGLLVKDVVERMLALVLLVATLPLMVVIALAVVLTSRGGPLFLQDRVARGGRMFRIYKFRTMHRDAEARLAALCNADDRRHVLFKLARDPRVTPVGRWLRRLSLDELPQLVNVLRGDMALVGPRPPLPDEVAMYPPAMRRRLLVKPGLTGLWQVSGRSDLSWEDCIRLDLEYVDNWSLALDARILLRTIPAVFGRAGAY